MKYVTITADRGFVEAPTNSPLDVSAGDLVVFDFQAGPEYIGFCVRDVLSSGSPARIIPEGGRGKIVLGVPTDALAGQESGFVRISQSDANTDCSVIFGRPSGDEGRAKVGP